MKKAKIGGLSLLGFLVFFSCVNISNAVPPSYVGVNIGDSYTWTAKANVANINTTAINIFGQANWSMVYDMLDLMVYNMSMGAFTIGDFFGGSMKFNIINMTPEVPLGPGLNGVALTIDGFGSIEPGVWMQFINSSWGPSMYLIDPTNINETNFMYMFGYGVPTFVPLGLPWSNIATWFNTLMAMTPPVYNNITFSALTDGFQVTILGEFMKLMMNMSGAPFPIPTLPNAVCNARWNAKGVFYYADVSVGGLTLATAELGAGEIPGFFIPITIGISVIAVIGLIAIIRKKKKII